jgi:hypothetical protein
MCCPEGERIYSPPQSPVLLKTRCWSLAQDLNLRPPAS